MLKVESHEPLLGGNKRENHYHRQGTLPTLGHVRLIESITTVESIQHFAKSVHFGQRFFFVERFLAEHFWWSKTFKVAISGLSIPISTVRREPIIWTDRL